MVGGNPLPNLPNVQLVVFGHILLNTISGSATGMGTVWYNAISYDYTQKWFQLTGCTKGYMCVV